MYARRVGCCPLVSNVDYAPPALLRLERYALLNGRKMTGQTDRQTDGRANVRPLHYSYIGLRLDAAMSRYASHFGYRVKLMSTLYVYKFQLIVLLARQQHHYFPPVHV